MIDEKTYQKIYDELSKFITPDWEKIIMYIEYGKESYTFSFYEKTKDGYLNGYDIPGVSEEDIGDAFKRIDKSLVQEREKENSLWTNMTMVVTKTGDMHIDFDYTDLSEGTYQFKKNWKKKYLK